MKRVCNMSADATFDLNHWLNSSDYHAECECVLIMNCTVIPPNPPLPPSGNCTFTCEDVQALQVNVANLTIMIGQQEDSIDMMIT